MDLLQLVVLAVVLCGVIGGGFWVIARAQFPIWANWIWGGVCLVILVAILLYFAGQGPVLTRPLLR